MKCLSWNWESVNKWANSTIVCPSNNMYVMKPFLILFLQDATHQFENHLSILVKFAALSYQPILYLCLTQPGGVSEMRTLLMRFQLCSHIYLWKKSVPIFHLNSTVHPRAGLCLGLVSHPVGPTSSILPAHIPLQSLAALQHIDTSTLLGVITNW